MGIFSCDYEDCERKARWEVYFKDAQGESKWCYLCFWHYLKVRFWERDAEGFCKVDTDRETLEQIREDLWSIQGDLMLIKEKMKIKEPKVYEEEKPEEKGFA